MKTSSCQNLVDSGDWGDSSFDGIEKGTEDTNSKAVSPPVDSSSVDGTLEKPGS